MREGTACQYWLSSHEAEPLSHNENGVSTDNSTKDPAGGAIHTTSDYRAAKKERPYYPGQTHTPPPLRRVSSNPTELGPVSAHRRVEGRTQTQSSLEDKSECPHFAGQMCVLVPAIFHERVHTHTHAECVISADASFDTLLMAREKVSVFPCLSSSS